MGHGHFLNSTGRHEYFLNSTGRHWAFIKSTRKSGPPVKGPDIPLKLTWRQGHFLNSTGDTEPSDMRQEVKKESEKGYGHFLELRCDMDLTCEDGVGVRSFYVSGGLQRDLIIHLSSSCILHSYICIYICPPIVSPHELFSAPPPVPPHPPPPPPIPLFPLRSSSLRLLADRSTFDTRAVGSVT